MASRKRNSSTSGAVNPRTVLSSKLDGVNKRPKQSISDTRYCPHCECGLSIKTYKKHRMLYYDQINDVWTKSSSNPSPSKEAQPAAATEEGPEVPDLEDSDGDNFTHGEEDPEVFPLGELDAPAPDNNSEDEVWEDDEGNIDTSGGEDEVPSLTTADSNSVEGTAGPALLTWLILFLSRLQAKYYISDTALACLLKFLYIFLGIIGHTSSVVTNMLKHFPTSIFLFKKYMNSSEETFVRYVVCRRCYSVYDYNKCSEKQGTSIVSKKCSYRPHLTFRKSCDTILLKTINLKGGKKKLIPFKVYCYNSLEISLQNLLLRQNFFELCEQWRKQLPAGTDILSDIYDGRIWKEFQFIDGKAYLASPNVYGLMINIDWFQPFKHTTASVGAIYLTIMNLPCSLRYKRENTILLGILPGPSEPEKNINQFLRPLVKELQQFYTGIDMKVHGHNEKRNVRCLLIGVTCDMPAGRKTCGFLSHVAHLGCCKCLKIFPGGVGCKNYAGFNRRNWKPRKNEHHRSCIDIIKKSKNKTEQEKLESKYGCRYSVLLQLPYFDPTRMLVVDPMHNLFLGTSKHMIKLWTNMQLLSRVDFESIQKTVNGMTVPSDIGRIPRKIETKFAGFTADQYKNWTIYYSIPALSDLFSNTDHLECWRYFVLACRRLCQKSITVSDINTADALLLQFCLRVERIYGNSAITPNMHMHCHLKDVLLDFGPVYSFWLFSYERYNGILQHQPSSNRSVEIEIMRRFISDNNAFAFQTPDEFQEELGSVCNLKPDITGSLLLQSQEVDTSSAISVQLPTSYKYRVFTDHEIELLTKLLSIFLKVSSNTFSVNSMCRSFKVIHINNMKLSCTIAMAEWNHTMFGQFPTVLPSSPVNLSDITLRPFRIEYLASACYSFNEESCFQNFTCAFVSWFKPHSALFELGKPAQVWCPDLFESDGVYSFIPLDIINIKQCVHTIMKINTTENVLVVVPIIS